MTLFHRELALLPTTHAATLAGDPLPRIQAVLEAMPVGQDAVPFLEALTGPQVLACLFVALYPLAYSGDAGDGVGLFSGMQRYTYLSTRLADAVQASSTLAEVFAMTARHLGLPVPSEAVQGVLLPFCTLLPQTQTAILLAMQQTLPLILAGARFVADAIKLTSERYARASAKPLQAAVVYPLAPQQLAQMTGALPERHAVLLPAVSGNALRHVMLREPCTTRLLGELGLLPDSDPVPLGVERFLYGGGNTAARVTAPGNADILEASVRRQYPSIDALGGAVDRFLFTRSQVSLASWIVCREHNAATAEVAGVTSEVSLLDTIHETTRTRAGIGGKDAASGQMIVTYEVLPLGTELLVEIRFQPFTSPLVKGCMQQAVADWHARGAMLGANTARGHGRCRVVRSELPYEAEAAAYLAYLREHREALAEGLRRGTFGTEMVLCAQT